MGGAVKVAVSGMLPIIGRRTADATYLAFSSRCQHEGCEVDLPNARGVILGPCHGSQYGGEGSLLRGPALSALPRYTVELQNSQLTLRL